MLADNPIGFWPCDEVSGTTAADLAAMPGVCRIDVRKIGVAPKNPPPIDTVVAAMGTERPAALRDAALIRVAYETLMRRSELVAMDVHHVEFERDGSQRPRFRRYTADPVVDPAAFTLIDDPESLRTIWRASRQLSAISDPAAQRDYSASAASGQSRSAT